MCDYYFDDEHEIAYKIDPISALVVRAEGNNELQEILVKTDVKVTNIKKEKVRRTLSEFFPTDKYDLESAKQVFSEKVLSKLVSGAKRISEQEYQAIKAKFEIVRVDNQY